MDQYRRNFIGKMATATGIALGTPFFQSTPGQKLLSVLKEYENVSPENCARDNDFWHYIQQAFTVSPNIINLNNGGVSPQPKAVQEAVERYNRWSNEAPSLYMWRTLDKGREPLRLKLANLAGVSPEELAVNRNSSEALETIIFGLRLEKGDEVILTRQDYPNMINAWKQRSFREGIELNFLNFEFPIENKDAMVQKFVSAFSDQTKVVHLTHMINWMGQILPVREIALEAKKRGIEVVVDAAHSFAHLDFKIPDLNCDYLGTSLHKWLCAPFGTGMLYVKKEKIGRLWPLFAGDNPESEDIRKFENLGTRSFAIEQAIGEAINFHEMIGASRKQKRLQYLKTYWTSKVAGLPRISIGTSNDPEFACAIALLKVEGMDPVDIANYLFKAYKIHTVSIGWENISGVRITPNVYTREKDLDRLVTAITKLVS